MKTLILAGTVIAAIASPAFAQNYIPSQASGNIAPMANPDGNFGYAPNDHSVAPRHHRSTHVAARRHESTAHESYAQGEADSARARGYSGRVRAYSGETDPDPNIQFQLNRESQEGCYTEGC